MKMRKPTMPNQTGHRSDKVDLQEVSRLVVELERDLDKVRAGSAGVDTLRREVEQLRAILDTPGSEGKEIHDGLQLIRARLHQVGEELQRDAIKVTDYITLVGRMLGM
jgi:hypothetical protein